MYRCCIFDLDGTLVNSIYAIQYTVNLMLERFGLGSIDEAHTKQFVGDGYQKLVERSLLYRGDLDLVYYEQALAVYRELFKEHSMYQVEAYEGIMDLLQYLKQKNMKLAVLSNKPHDRTIENVDGIFGNGFFDVVSGEREDIRRKPDPAGAFKTAEILGLNPEECLYVGDTNTDMETGIAAGMDTVGVTWGFRDREELEAYHPKYLADHPGEVIAILEDGK